MRACPACGRTGVLPLATVAGYRMVECSGCRTLFTCELPEAGGGCDYDEYYDESNLSVPEFVRGRLDELVASFEPVRKLNRWLDVGCGAGVLVRSAAAAGWEIMGTEVAPVPANALRADGFEVLIGELKDLELPPRAFDVVTMIEVLEHVPDPGKLLSKATELLRPGGIFYATTPHARGLSGRLLGTRWSIVSPPEHLQLFTVDGLRRALTAAGLRPRKLTTRGVNPYELVSGLAARVRAGEAQQFDRRVETSYDLNRSLSSRPAGRLAKGLANSALTATRLGDSIRVTAEAPNAVAT
jgi:SAM-dependent methyltransferase